MWVKWRVYVLGITSLVLAAIAGFTASQVFGAAPAPTRTVTINVGTGPQGPPGPKGDTGPQGPPGAPGTIECPTGFSPGDLVINHPGGQVTVYACLKD